MNTGFYKAKKSMQTVLITDGMQHVNGQMRKLTLEIKKLDAWIKHHQPQNDLHHSAMAAPAKDFTQDSDSLMEQITLLSETIKSYVNKTIKA